MPLPRFLFLAWLRFAWFLRKTFGIKTYAIGWAASKVAEDFEFQFMGRPFRFLVSAARSYCLLPAGIPNEPETHKFLDQILDAGGGCRIIFVDVGASIGEFAVPMAYDARVEKVMAFEPHPATCEALRATAVQVPEGKIEIIQKGVSDKLGNASFDLSNVAPTGAGLRDSSGIENALQVELCTLDETIQISPGQAMIILIDIEGGELDAMRGAMQLIARIHPLIIFEFNEITRKYFQLSQAAEQLGTDYKIYRLRSEDGCLDGDLSSTWNVVALPDKGPWRDLHTRPGLIVA